MDFEIARDELHNNFSSFRFYYERAEKISTFNFKQKIDWTISAIQKNLAPRLSPKNRLNIEYDFYKNCREVLYNKFIIHTYLFEILEAEVSELELNPNLENLNISLLIQGSSKTSKLQSEESYILSANSTLNFSTFLKDTFIDVENFNKMNFNKLKVFNLVYEKESNGYERKGFYKTDLIVLLIVMQNLKIIRLPSQKYITNIIKEAFQDTISPNAISEIFQKFSGARELNQSDKDRISNSKDFIESNLN